MTSQIYFLHLAEFPAIVLLLRWMSICGKEPAVHLPGMSVPNVSTNARLSVGRMAMTQGTSKNHASACSKLLTVTFMAELTKLRQRLGDIAYQRKSISKLSCVPSGQQLLCTCLSDDSSFLMIISTHNTIAIMYQTPAGKLGTWQHVAD